MNRQRGRFCEAAIDIEAAAVWIGTAGSRVFDLDPLISFEPFDKYMFPTAIRIGALVPGDIGDIAQNIDTWEARLIYRV